MKRGLEQGKVNTIPMEEIKENFSAVVNEKRAMIQGEKGPFGYITGPGSPDAKKKSDKKKKVTIDLGNVDFMTSLRGVHQDL
jgi:hypothetical protein